MFVVRSLQPPTVLSRKHSFETLNMFGSIEGISTFVTVEGKACSLNPAP